MDFPRGSGRFCKMMKHCQRHNWPSLLLVTNLAKRRRRCIVCIQIWPLVNCGASCIPNFSFNRTFSFVFDKFDLKLVSTWCHNDVRELSCYKYKYASLKNLPIPNIFPQKRRIRPLFSVALLLPCHAIDNQNTRNARAVVFWAGFFHCPEGSPKLVLLHPSFSKFRFQGGESHKRPFVVVINGDNFHQQIYIPDINMGS